jgi:hypothetical protein
MVNVVPASLILIVLVVLVVRSKVLVVETVAAVGVNNNVPPPSTTDDPEPRLPFTPMFPMVETLRVPLLMVTDPEKELLPLLSTIIPAPAFTRLPEVDINPLIVRSVEEVPLATVNVRVLAAPKATGHEMVAPLEPLPEYDILTLPPRFNVPVPVIDAPVVPDCKVRLDGPVVAPILKVLSASVAAALTVIGTPAVVLSAFSVLVPLVMVIPPEPEKLAGHSLLTVRLFPLPKLYTMPADDP